MVYFSGYGSYRPIMIGDSYVIAMQKETELAIEQVKRNNISYEMIKLDIQRIQKVEDRNGWIRFIEIGTFPYYSLDLKLSTYETLTRFYVLYSQTHQILEIN